MPTICGAKQSKRWRDSTELYGGRNRPTLLNLSERLLGVLRGLVSKDTHFVSKSRHRNSLNVNDGESAPTCCAILTTLRFTQRTCQGNRTYRQSWDKRFARHVAWMIHPTKMYSNFFFGVPYVSHQEELEPEAPKSGKSVEQHKSFAQGHAGL